MTEELGRQYSPQALASALNNKEKIVYSLNGNRAANGRTFLKKIEKLCPLVGVRRVGDISHLTGAPYPVFQSCRPNLLLHTEYGQNSGALGKGTTETQAKISCIMEAIEGYCSEPRSPHLIRASFRYLAQQYAVLDPRKLLTQFDVDPPSLDEPLMWTPAYSVKTGSAIWVPAETVYCPFVNKPYRTRSLFISASNGLSSGSTYLEAVVHGLYELIERYYLAKMEQGGVTVEAMFEDQVKERSVQAYLRVMGDEDQVQLYSIELPGVRNLPMIMCCLVADNTLHQGWGCSPSIEMSVSRAFSEAMQSRATVISGSRENMPSIESGARAAEESIFGKATQPEERTLSLKALRARAIDKRFTSLDQEYQFVLAWLRARSLDNVIIANLTRQGIDVPVVKVLIPELAVPSHFRTRTKTPYQPQTSTERQFRTIQVAAE